MEKTATGVIRKIIIGEDPMKALSYEVNKVFGSPKGELKVTEIVEDQSNYYFFGNIRYNIYVEKADKSNVIWKSFERLPIILEYFV